MALFENLLDCLGVDGEITPYKYRCYIYGTCGGWFEGVTIVSYTPEEVLFAVRGGNIKVTGKNLTVKKYVEREVALGGEIFGVNRV